MYVRPQSETRRRTAHQPTSPPRTADLLAVASSATVCGTCKRVGAQILSLGTAFGGLAGGLEGAGAAAQDEVGRPDPLLWQGWPRGAAAAEGGRRVNRLRGATEQSKGNSMGDVLTMRTWLGLGLGSGMELGLRVRVIRL